MILSIGGFDPSSGAGVSADVKTAAAHGCFAVTCITALTVPSTLGVKAVDPVRPEIVRRTLEALIEDFEIFAVRIGMLGSAGVAQTVADLLKKSRLPNIVVDPIVKSSSGAALIEEAGMQIVREQFLPIAKAVTPNVDEAEALTGIKVEDKAGQRAAAGRLLELGSEAAVVTGGHLTEAADLLLWREADGVHEECFTAPDINSRNTHGTGCAFATSLACELANGRSLPEAVRTAKAFVRRAIESAPDLGHGRGPLELLWPLKNK